MKAQEKHEGRAARTSGGGERMEPSRVSIQRDQRYRISPGYVLREIAGEVPPVPHACAS